MISGDYDYYYEEDRMGMQLTGGSVQLDKDTNNLVGISIGGGAPLCPCLYVVQIFDNTPASKDGTLASGDEIVGVNNQSCKGKTKVEVARMIQGIKGRVTINYNKLHAEPKQGKSLDIVLKKIKHKLVENMSAETADALGLSRAILCNDGLVKKLNELERTGNTYKGLIHNLKCIVKHLYHQALIQKQMGAIFCEVGCKDPHKSACDAFTKFGEAHRKLERNFAAMLKEVRPMLNDLNTFLTKAIPDTKLTIKKYLDVKFEYLSYCLKVKELDDEEYSYAAMQRSLKEVVKSRTRLKEENAIWKGVEERGPFLKNFDTEKFDNSEMVKKTWEDMVVKRTFVPVVGEPLYRVETGNYEYRLILRCRQDARERFASMRNDVLVKLELLDQKHVQDLVLQLYKFLRSLEKYHVDCYECMTDTNVFPIEVALNQDIFTYGQSSFAEDGLENEVAGCAIGTPRQQETLPPTVSSSDDEPLIDTTE